METYRAEQNKIKIKMFEYRTEKRGRPARPPPSTGTLLLQYTNLRIFVGKFKLEIFALSLNIF